MSGVILLAFVYWLGQRADAYTGWQTFTRPIVFGSIVGLFCGDLKTGVILGAELEAIYMGVSSIGGEMPSNYQAATVLCADQLIPTILVFMVALGGELALQVFLENCPVFILNGLNASAGMLVVVGLCLTAQAILDGAATVMFVLLGFVLTKFLGLGTMPVAVIGIIIAFAHFQSNSRIKDAKEKNRAAFAGDDGEGDDFFG